VAAAAVERVDRYYARVLAMAARKTQWRLSIFLSNEILHFSVGEDADERTNQSVWVVQPRIIITIKSKAACAKSSANIGYQKIAISFQCGTSARKR
jgi:hypothetical protein